MHFPTKLSLNFEKVLIIADAFKVVYGKNLADIIKTDHALKSMNIKRQFVWFINKYTNLYDYEIARLFDTYKNQEHQHEARVMNEYIEHYNFDRSRIDHIAASHRQIQTIIDNIIQFPLT